MRTRIHSVRTTLSTLFACQAVFTAALSNAAMPRTATIIPAPREMAVTGGEYWARTPPKMEKVASIPPEGYELSITTNGMTIRHSDDAGAYYAKMTLFHSGRFEVKEKCKVTAYCWELRHIIVANCCLLDKLHQVCPVDVCIIYRSINVSLLSLLLAYDTELSDSLATTVLY